VTIDTLRATRARGYGRAGRRDPLDRPAWRAPASFSTSPTAHNVVTLPSARQHPLRPLPLRPRCAGERGLSLPPGMETLATLLRGHALIGRGAFVSAFPLDSRFGLDRGFEVYDDRLGDAEASSDFRMQERAGTRTVAAPGRGSRPRRGLRSAGCTLRAPRSLPATFRVARAGAHRLRRRVTAADAALAPLLEPLLARGRNSDTWSCSPPTRRGPGRSREATHGVFAYESTLRVPLVFHNRACSPPGVAAGARHVDLVPTILDALVLPAPEGLPGRSLLGLAGGRDRRRSPGLLRDADACADARLGAHPRPCWRDRLKYLDSPLPELYDLAADPREEANLVASRPPCSRSCGSPRPAARRRRGPRPLGRAGRGAGAPREPRLRRRRRNGRDALRRG